MDKLQTRKVKVMSEIEAYKQEEQNRDFGGSLILTDDKKFGHGGDVSILEIAYDKKYQKMQAYGAVDWSEKDISEAEKKLKDRTASQKKMIKDNASDKVDLMVLTKQNPYLMAEWLRASKVANGASESFDNVVVAMDNMLNCEADKTEEASRLLKHAVSSYLDSHKESPWTISGRQRVRMCRGILERVDSFPEIVSTRRKLRQEKEEGEQNKAESQQNKDEAEERLEKQPEKLREYHNALLSYMEEIRAACEMERGSGNSEFMNNVISQVIDFDNYINSNRFSFSNPLGYMKRFLNMRNTISLYYEKNKGSKWTEKGAGRRDLTKNILERLNDWAYNLPKDVIEADMAKEMVYVDDLKNQLATMNDKKYGTSDDKETWFTIQRDGDTFFNNLEEKTDEQAGADLANLLKSALGYLGTHTGKKSTQKGKDRVEYAKKIVSSISNILRNGTFATRIATFDAILENRNNVNRPGDAEANALIKDFLTQYAIDELHADYGTKTGAENFITEKTAIYMHNRDKFFSDQHSIRYLTKGDLEKTIFGRGNDSNTIGKSFRINRYGKVDPKYANDAKIAELSVNRALKADPTDATYISRSALVKKLEQVKITPEMFTKEYLDSHYLEMHRILSSLMSIQNTFNDWTGECNTACNKELDSYPPSVQKKLDLLKTWRDTVHRYYYNTEVLNCFNFHRGIDFRKKDYIEEIIQAGIPQEMDKITDQEKKRAYLKDKKEKEYDGVDYFYEEVEVSKGKFEVRDASEAQLIKAKRFCEENDITITEEDIKAVRYFAYVDEAQKESEKLKANITPEAVAMRKMIKLGVDFSDQMTGTDDAKEVAKVYPKQSGMLNRAYIKKLRFVNYNKDGKPATKEDEKNLEWNKAFTKSIIENKQEDRIRLLKENFEYIADLINNVDFDRILDFDYWVNNKDLYIALSNFSLVGLSLADSHLQKEDVEIMREFFADKTPMMRLIDDFTDAFAAYEAYLGQLGAFLYLDKHGEYNIPEAKESENKEAYRMILEGLAQETKERFDKAKKSNVDYIASKNEYTMPGVSETINKLSFQAEKNLNQEMQDMKLAQSIADADYDFISETKIPMEKQLLKSSTELIVYKNELMSSGKKIAPEVIDWLDTHIRHWKKIEHLRLNKPTQKPDRAMTVKRNGQKINVDSSYVPENSDEVLLDNVAQVGFQSHGNSCWSRVAQTLLNYQGVDIDQTEIRAFRRSDLNEYNYMGQGGSESVVANKMGSIDIDVNELVLQTTDKVGMEIKQYDPSPILIEDKQKSTEKDIKYKEVVDVTFMQHAIMEEVKRVILEHKVPIALLVGKHYRTIVGFKGDNTLLVKDPQDKEDGIDSDSVREVPISTLTGHVALEWLRELTFEADGSCKEVLEKSLEVLQTHKEANTLWQLKNGEYRSINLNNGFDDTGNSDIGEINIVKAEDGFSVSKMFKFNRKMN